MRRKVSGSVATSLCIGLMLGSFAPGLTVPLSADEVASKGEIIRDFDYSNPDDIQKGRWVDDGAWMNSLTTFGEAKDPENGDNAYTFSFRGRSQIYHTLPALKKDKVYKIDIELKGEGQIEAHHFYFRNIRSPWKNWGGKHARSLGPERTTFSAQLRMEDDTKNGQVGLFFRGTGTGSMHLYNMTVTETDDFVETEDIAEAGNLLENSRFYCMDAGWVLSRGAKWSPGRIYGPGSLNYRDPVRLQIGVPYVIEIDGTSGLDFGYRLGMGKNAIRGNGRIRDGKYIDEFKIEQPYYGSKLESVSRTLTVGLRDPEDETVSAITEFSIYSGEKQQEPECGFRFAEEIIAAEHIVTLGEDVELAFGTKDIPEGAEAVIEVLDHRDRKFMEIPVSIESRNDGRIGGRLNLDIDHTGWMYFRMKYDGEVVGGFPGELVVVGPDPSDGKNSDFVLGSHLGFDEPGVTGRRSADLALSQARQLGITGTRKHTRHIRWWFVEDEETGDFHYSDWSHDLPISHGITPLGMLDGTARRASSAPDDVLAQEKNQWPRGWGAYPAKDIEDWKEYVTKMVTHFKDRIEFWEVWNEPDHMFLQINPEYDTDRQSAYMRLLKGAYTAAKEADPNSKIVAGSVTAGGKNFLLKSIEDGMLDYCDAISFHGYGRLWQTARVGAAAYEDILNALREAMEEQGTTKPVWDTESGFGVHSGIRGAAGAELAIKAVLSKRAAGLDRYYMYSGYYRNYAGHTGHRMHVGYAGRPLVIQGLLAAYDRRLGNANFTANIGDDSAGIHVYEFENTLNGQKVVAAWYSGADGEMTFSQDSIEEGKVFDIAGNECGEFSEGELHLDDEVKYFVKK